MACRACSSSSRSGRAPHEHRLSRSHQPRAAAGLPHQPGARAADRAGARAQSRQQGRPAHLRPGLAPGHARQPDRRQDRFALDRGSRPRPGRPDDDRRLCAHKRRSGRPRHHLGGGGVRMLQPGRADLAGLSDAGGDAGGAHHHAALLQARTARPVAEPDAPGPALDPAVCRALLRHSAGAARPELRTLQRAQPVPDLAHGGADLWHQPGRLCRAARYRRPPWRAAPGPVGRTGVEHRHQHGLRAPRARPRHAAARGGGDPHRQPGGAGAPGGGGGRRLPCDPAAASAGARRGARLRRGRHPLLVAQAARAARAGSA